MRVVLAYVTCALVWGTTWYAIRVCIGGPDGYPTYEAAALRFAIAAALLLGITVAFRLGPWPRRRAQWLWLIGAGLFDAAGYTLVYLGEERISGGLGAVVFGIYPLVLAILLAATGMEKVRPAAVIGAIVSIAGVAIIFLDRREVSPEQGVGVALILGSVVCSAIYSMLMKQAGDDVHPFVATAVFLAVTAIAIGAIVLVRGPATPVWPPALDPTLALLYLAVFGSVITFGTYFWLMRHLSLMAMSTLSFVLPLVSLSVDALWEHEIRLGGRAYLGVAVVLSGLAVSLLLERRDARRAPAPRSADTT